MNFFSLKNYLTKKQFLPDNHAKILNFESGYINNWQIIPSNITQKLLDEKERYSDCKIGKQVIIFGLQNQKQYHKKTYLNIHLEEHILIG